MDNTENAENVIKNLEEKIKNADLDKNIDMEDETPNESLEENITEENEEIETKNEEKNRNGRAGRRKEKESIKQNGKNKKNIQKGKDEDKVPPSKIDKILNYLIIFLILVIIGIIIYICTIIFNTKKNEIPEIEKHILEYTQKDKYTYQVTVENTDKKEKKNIKITKLDNILEYQISENGKSYAIVKEEDKDPIYIVEKGEIQKIDDTQSEEYKKYSSEINKEYLNIKKYSPTSLLGIKSKNDIIFSNGKTKLQFNKDTHLPEAFIKDNEKICFEFTNEEPKLILPYLKTEIKQLSEENKTEDNTDNK